MLASDLYLNGINVDSHWAIQQQNLFYDLSKGAVQNWVQLKERGLKTLSTSAFTAIFTWSVDNPFNVIALCLSLRGEARPRLWLDFRGLCPHLASLCERSVRRHMITAVFLDGDSL